MSDVNEFAALRELILLDDLKKKNLPDHLVVHLNDQRITSLSAAAVMADEFVLTKLFFQPRCHLIDLVQPLVTPVLPAKSRV